MTQDDVIRLARDAGWSYMEAGMDKQRLEAFAKLVEQHKCEELSAKIERMPFGTTGESFAVWIREQA